MSNEKRKSYHAKIKMPSLSPEAQKLYEAEKARKMLENEKPIFPQEFSQWTLGQKVWTLYWNLAMPLFWGIGCYGWLFGIAYFFLNWLLNRIVGKVTTFLIAKYLLNEIGYDIFKILGWAIPPFVFIALAYSFLYLGYTGWIYYPLWMRN